MNILDVILARPISLDEAEEALGRPDPEEEKDLRLHVSRCSKRWAMSYRMSKYNAVLLGQLRLLLILGLILAAIYLPPVQRFFHL
jgi:hypothetical protein